MNRVAAEADIHLDVAAAVQVQIGAAGAAQPDDDELLLEWRLHILEVDQRLRLPAVLLDEDVLDGGDGVVGLDLDVLDLAKAVALVEDVDGLHVVLSLKRRPGGSARSGSASLIATARQNWKGAARDLCGQARSGAAPDQRCDQPVGKPAVVRSEAVLDWAFGSPNPFKFFGGLLRPRRSVDTGGGQPSNELIKTVVGLRERRHKLKQILFALAFLCVGSSLALADEIKAGDLVVTQAWSRATPKGAKTGGAYLTIENKGSTPDRLVGGSADAAGKVEIHEMTMTKGVMKMRPMDKGLEIAPGKTVKLAPRSLSE
jgi:copper(I)-binding protein